MFYTPRKKTKEPQIMNVVALIGNLASDPELRHTAAGKAVCNFRIAVSRGGGDTADFFSIVTWDRQAEIANEYLSKGRRVGIEGRMQHRTWETDSGDKRSAVEIVAHRVTLLGSRQDEAAPEPVAVASAPSDHDDIPF
jgi:single-strand DNA-binding protein